MDYFSVLFFLIPLLAIECAKGGGDKPFDQNYYQTFGGDHLTVLDQGKEVQILLDVYTGAGFSSKNDFGSGYFRMSIKIPEKNSTGIDTGFYLTSVPVGKPADGVNHYEFDVEFFGTDGNPHMLSTNVFANDLGHREQQFHLWFDPTLDFHTYDILWNQHQIVWFVDGTPIRVWKNNKQLRLGFPRGPMHVEASIWSPSWLRKPDWNQGPFKTHYRNLSIEACPYQSSNPGNCSSQSYYWNQNKYWQLSSDQESQLRDTRKKYLREDYCNNRKRRGPECEFNY